MKFLLIDKIEVIEPGKKIVTSKYLSLAEEYLQDHFPSFPVLPGVLMLEAMTQSAAWLIRLEQDFVNSLVTLKAVKNVKYAYFLQPGNTMRLEVDMKDLADNVATFRGKGYVGDTLAVSAKLELTWQNVPGGNADLDAEVLAQIRQNWSLVGGPAALEAAGRAQ